MAPLLLALALLQAPAPLPPPILVNPRDPKSVGALVNRGRLFLRRKQYREAVTELTALLREHPDLEIAWNLRGNAHYRLGDFAGALADQTEAIRLNPRFIPAYRDRGATRTSMGDIAGAERDRATVLELLKRITIRGAPPERHRRRPRRPLFLTPAYAWTTRFHSPGAPHRTCQIERIQH